MYIVRFHPSVNLQRRDGEPVTQVIQRGDVLHCDFGIVALGLATDTQHMAYVLREAESDAPEGLRRALANTNRLQDILLEEMRVGRSGNEVLTAVLSKMRSAGLNGTMYIHSRFRSSRSRSSRRAGVGRSWSVVMGVGF